MVTAAEPIADGLDRLYAKVAWRIVPILFAAYICAYLDRVNVGFAKLQMLKQLGFSETIYGLGAGIFFIGYFLFEAPSNLILHRVGARVWIARIMISWAVISALMMVVKTPLIFYLLRFLLGVAEAGFFPGVILYLTYWFPAERRGKVTAIFMSAIAVSSLIGSLLSGWIVTAFDGAAGWAGWQWLFLIEASPSLVMGLVIFFALDDGVSRAQWLDEGEKAQLSADLARDALLTEQRSLAATLADGRLWFCCLIYFCFIMGLYGISFWLPTLIADLGVKSLLMVGLFSAIPYAAASVGMMLTGRSADQRRERRWHLAVPALAGGVGLALTPLASGNVVLAMAALSLATYGVLTSLPLFWSLPTAFMGGVSAALGIATINSVGNLAGFVSPYLMGWTKDLTHSTATGMYMLGGFLALGAVLVIAGIPARLVNR